MAAEPQTTRSRILNTAQRLFGKQGFPRTSLRQITDEAGVNLAAVNYHCGSKEDLYKTLLIDRLHRLNDERVNLLAQAGQLAGEQPVPVRSILETFIRPLLRLAASDSAGGDSFMRLVSRELADPQPFMMADLANEVDPVVERYTRVLTQTLPEIPRAELFWRMQFAISGIIHAAAHQRDFERVSCGLCQADDADGCIRRLIDFCAAGLEAPHSSSGADRPL
jgi:AcrR family transcriptional regulator